MESDSIPEVRWYKDNLPLTSPDYETRYDRGLATLTIEEIFSEDTARYTCRITNQAGSAESSAYLTVKGEVSWLLFFFLIVANSLGVMK